MVNKDKWLKILVEVCRVLIGMVFIFSGFVKAIDPLGSAYKFHEYFVVWDCTFLDFSTLPAAFSLSTFEFVLGVCLLVGIHRKIVGFFSLLFMCLMTLLALYLLVFHPVKDCGCFGDALLLTNKQTFYKNLVLISISIIVFLQHKRITPLLSEKFYFLIVLFASIFILGISFYCYTYLPIVDFRPYKIGNNILKGMIIPEGVATDIYRTTFIYEKEGIQQEFTIDNYPKGDSSWKFIDSKSILIKKGYEPPIHDFIITDSNGEDVTEKILLEKGYTFLMIAYLLEKAQDMNIDKINELYNYAQQNDYNFICLTSSSSTTIKKWREDMGAEYPIYTMDVIILKTMIRSNPGIVLLKNATIIDKWANRQIPQLSSSLEDSLEKLQPTNHNIRNIFLVLLIFIILFSVLVVLDNIKSKK